MAGAVFYCTIRDIADIAAPGFQVFARGYRPEATAKTDPGAVDVAVAIGGVPVHPGDIMVGDDDGVVAIPARLAAEVLREVAGVAAREEAIRARIRAGESTFQVFDLGRS